MSMLRYIMTVLVLLVYQGIQGQSLVNDWCNNAQAVELPITGYTCIQGSNLNATSDGNINSCDMSPAGNEVWFKYVTNGDSNAITVTPNALTPVTDLVMSVYTGSCDAPTLVNCSSATAGNSLQFGTRSIPIGTTVWISVESEGTDGDFQLCIQSDAGIIPGDGCATAPTICDVNPFTVTSLAGYTSDGITISCADGNQLDGQSGWITFDVTTTGALYFTITPLGPDEYDWGLYDITTDCVDGTTNGGTPVSVACNTHVASFGGGGGCGVQGAPTGSLPFGDELSQPCPAEFTSFVFVQAGRRYGILISNADGTGNGFSFDWGNSSAELGASISLGVSPNEACSAPAATTISSTTAGDITNTTWDMGDGTIGTGAVPSSHTFTENGDYLVSVMVENSTGCKDVETKRVNLNKGPVITITPENPTQCSGDDTPLTGAIALGTPFNFVDFLNTTATGIPNNNPAGLNSIINVSGIAPTNLVTGMLQEICFTVSHTRHEDILSSSITSPNGTTYELLPADYSGVGSVTYCFPDSTLSRIDGAVNGVWTLNVVDDVNKTMGVTHVGALLNWSITVGDSNSITSYSWTPNDGSLSSTSILNPIASPITSTTYTLTGTDANGCSSSDTSRVTTATRPTASISSSDTVCFGDSVLVEVTLTGTAPFEFILRDESGVDDTISNYMTTTYSFYEHNTKSYHVASVTDIGCPGDPTDTMFIYVNPEITAAVIDTNCNLAATKYVITVDISGGLSSTYSITGSTGMLTLGSPTSTYVMDSIASLAPYFFQVTDKFGCNSVNFNGGYKCECSAGASVDGDSIVCDGDSAGFQVVLEGTPGPGWTLVMTDGVTDYTSNPLSSPATFYASGAGTYTIKSIEDANCEDVGTGSATLTVNSRPTATISGTNTICPADSAQICINLTGQAPFTFSYRENNSGQDSIVTGHMTNSYCFYSNQNSDFTLNYVSDLNCDGSVSGNAVINIIDAVVVDSVVSENNLAATTYVVTFKVSGGDTLTYNVAGDAGNLVLGSPNLFTSDPITCGQSYFFVVTDGINCTPDTIQGTHTCVCAASATITGGGTICEGDSVPLNVVLGGNGPWTINYTDGNGNNFVHNSSSNTTTIWAKTSGTYSISTVSDQNCTDVATGSAVVVVNPLPTASLSGNETICEGDTAYVTITFSGSPTWNFNLSSSAITSSTTSPLIIPVTSTSTYSISSLTDQFCPATSMGTTASITVLPQDTAEFDYVDSIYCQGIATIDPVITPNTDLGGVFLINPALPINNSNGRITLDSNSFPGTYTITYTSPSLTCSAKYTDRIVIREFDQATFSYASSTACPDGTALPTLDAGTVPGGTYTVSPATLTIDPNTGEIDLTTGVIGQCYDITYTTPSAGCQFSEIFEICFQNSIEASFTYSDSIVCDNTGLITATLGTNTGSGGTFSSSAGLDLNTNDGTINTVNSTSNQSYTVYYTTAPGLCQAIDSASITIQESPVGIDTTANLCEYAQGEGVSLYAEQLRFYEHLINDTNSTFQVTWYASNDTGGIGTKLIREDTIMSIADQTTFWAQIQNGGYCQTISSITFNVRDFADAGSNSIQSINANAGEVDLNTFLRNTDITSGLWYDSTWALIPDNQVLAFTAAGQYYFVHVPDPPCANDTSAHTIEIKGGILYPTAFTPNNDQNNDLFTIYGLNIEYPDCDVYIFNRWGELMYESLGGYDPWDGKRNGKDVPTATYYYVIKYNDGVTDDKKGTVSVLR